MKETSARMPGTRTDMADTLEGEDMMEDLFCEKTPDYIIPADYRSALDVRRTEAAIKKVKDFFEDTLSEALNLTRVSAPLFVEKSSGINDNLNGTERMVHFDIKDDPDVTLEIVNSLAKWKRYALGDYGFHPGEGLYTDMNAIRRDETLDCIHSIYVDQWDWEKVIKKEDRTIETLMDTVKKIYGVFKKTEQFMRDTYPSVPVSLPDDITFFTTQELEDLYPALSPKEREDIICKKYGAVFLMQIGGALESGQKHDGRSPDYDDWSLNGDILFYYPLFDRAIELSSMGIRVDETALTEQLKTACCEQRSSLPFHSALLCGKLPYTIGGGIGQSRICMFFLGKAHIGEVQSSYWPKEMRAELSARGIHLL